MECTRTVNFTGPSRSATHRMQPPPTPASTSPPSPSAPALAPTLPPAIFETQSKILLPTPTYLIIGHVSKDINVIKEKTAIAPGGGVFFSSVAAIRLGLRASALTKCAEKDRALFHEIEECGVKVTYIESKNSTSCMNHYPSDNPDDRRQAMVSLAEPFTAQEVKSVPKVDFLHINPLWFGEFPEKLIPVARSRCKFLIGDAQGFIRHVDGQTMHHKDWANKKQYLKHFDLFKIDNKEAKVLCDTENLEIAVKKIHKWGAKMVIATQADRVYLYDGQRNFLYVERFGSYPMEGRTGRGDTVTVSFVAELRGQKDFSHALKKAAHITTQKMQYPGPYRGGATVERAKL